MKFHLLSWALYLGISSTGLAALLSPEMLPGSERQRLANEAVDYYNEQLRYSLPVPVVVQNSQRRNGATLQAEIQRGIDLYSADGLTVPGLIDSNGEWTWTDRTLREFCLMNLFNGTDALSPDDLRAHIAHETFHCYSNWLKGGYTQAQAMAPWIYEGTTEWAANKFNQGWTGGDNFYRRYFTEPARLFDRSYDAYPFFMHLDLAGADMFAILYEMWTSTDTLQAWNNLVAMAGLRPLAQWAMAHKHDPGRGPEWDYRAYRNVPSEAVALRSELLDTTSLPMTRTSEIGKVESYEMYLPRDRYIKMKAQGGVIGYYYTDPAGQGQTRYLGNGADVTFCEGERCGCDDGSAATNVVRVGGGLVSISFLGTEQEASLHWSEGERFCCNGSGGFDSRLVGTWRYEDPQFARKHFTVHYQDERIFQGGGATLVISPNGAIEKTYDDLHAIQSVRGRHSGHLRSASFTLTGSWRGCLQTRTNSADPLRGSTVVTGIQDNVRQYHGQAHLPPVVRNSEWHATAFCVSREEPCNGNYRLDPSLTSFAAYTPSRKFVRVSGP